MKKTTLFTLMLLGHLGLFSQTYKNTFSVSFGPSMPLGDFKSTAVDNELAGNARTGLSAEISYHRSLKHNFGLEISGYGQRNTIDVKSLAMHLSGLGIGPVPNPITGESIYFDNWIFQDNKWTILGLMAGVNYTIPVRKEENKLSVIPRVLIGINYSHIGESFAESKKEFAYARYKMDKASAFSPSFVTGVSINYQLNPKWGIRFNLDYFATTKVKYKDVQSGIIGGGLIVAELYKPENINMPVIGYNTTADQKQVLNGLDMKVGLSSGF